MNTFQLSRGMTMTPGILSAVREAISVPLEQEEAGDYKDHAASWHETAFRYLADEIEYLEWKPKKTKGDLIRVACLKGAMNIVSKYDGYNCPRAWLEFTSEILKGQS